MKIRTVLAIACWLLPALSLAAAPAWIPVQAYLTDADGNPLDGEHDIDLRLYDADAGGAALFDENHTVMVEQGLVTLYLGANQALDLSLFRDQDELYLGIEIDGDGEMSPRLTLGSVPFAGHARFADDAMTLQGHTPADFRTSGDPVGWADLSDVPAWVSDGDDDTLAGLNCSEGYVAKFLSGAWQCAQDESGMGAHTHSGDDITSAVAVAQSANSAPWAGLTGVPAGFADGVDNVGDGLGGSGTANNLALFTAADAVGDSVLVQDGTYIGVDKTPEDKLDVAGSVRAGAFRSAIGSLDVDPGTTNTEVLSFSGRSVYIVKASWSGSMMEGTRAWFVITHNDMNHFTGHPTIIEIGMTSGSYHYSSTLNLGVDANLPYNQLRLSCERSHGGDTRPCLWSTTRVAAR